MTDTHDFQAHNFEIHQREKYLMDQQQYAERYAKERLQERFVLMTEYDLSMALSLETKDSEIGKAITNCIKENNNEMLMKTIVIAVKDYLYEELLAEGSLLYDEGER